MLKKHRPRLLKLSLSVGMLLMLLLSACGGTTTTTTTSTTPTAGTPVKGGTWIDDLYEDTTSVIPNGSSQTYAYLLEQAIWAPLFVGDPKGNINAGLASEVPSLANGDISPDLKTWTFKLRPNLVWSDGQPLNADDVNYTWKLWTGKSKFTPASTVGFNLIKSTDVSADKLSIIFHLSAGFEPFLSQWTDSGFAPMPAHIFSSIPDDQILKSAQNLKPTVSSGPFIMSESVHGDHYTVVRNPKYYLAAQGFPYLDKVVFRIVTNQDTILSDFQSGSITSSWFLDVTKTPVYRTLAGYHIATNPINSNFEALYFNLNNAALKDVNVRKAIAMAIDQPTLIATARFGQASPLCTNHSPAYHPGYQPNPPCPKFDIAAANALLTQAGWVQGADGVRTKGNLRLEFQYSTTANNSWRKADTLINQANFAKIGVKTDIQYYPASTFFGTILPGGKPGTYDMAEFENNYGYDADDSSQFACNQIPSAANSFGGGNWDWYCNPQADALYKQEQSTADPTLRQQAFDQLHQIYLTDFPFVTLYAPTDLAVTKNNTYNYLPGPGSAAETVNIWTWWCTGGTC